MRRLQTGALSLAALMLVLSLTVAGCGKKEEPAVTDADKGGDTKEKKEKKEKKAKSGEKKALAAGKGTFKGRVTLEGKVDTAELTKKLLAEIEKKADDKPHCLDPNAPAEEKEQQTWVLGKDNGVGNVFVMLRPAEGTIFEIEESHPGVQAVKGKELALDQPHCAFVPRALVVFPSFRDKSGKTVETGQKFVVKNSAKISHNTKYGDGGFDNPGQNLTIKAGDQIDIKDLKPSNRPVSAQCNIHPWMAAHLWVVNNPYYAITDKDGNFEIKNVPEGEVNVVVWHEGKFINAGEGRGEKITLSDGETKKDFVIKAP
jgi:predicted small lipoprotein YifL